MAGKLRLHHQQRRSKLSTTPAVEHQSRALHFSEMRASRVVAVRASSPWNYVSGSRSARSCFFKNSRLVASCRHVATLSPELRRGLLSTVSRQRESYSARLMSSSSVNSESLQSRVHDMLAEDDIEVKQEDEYKQYEEQMRLARETEEQRMSPESEPQPPQRDEFKWIYIDYEEGMADMPWLRFGRFSLRENCQCSECNHPDTSQRMSDTFSIPRDVVEQSIEHKPEGVEIAWSDGHKGIYSWDWLVAHQQNVTRISSPRHRPFLARPRPALPYWPFEASLPTVFFDEVMSEDGCLLEWLEKIHWRGFCMVKGVPPNPESTKALIERIAFIRHTHYGGFWDFTADLTFKDTAYTNEFLGAHTDNTYFTDPARLQLFHLLSHTDGKGGSSLLVDGFAAAMALLKEDPEHYNALLEHRQPWHASGNEGICIQPAYQAPVLRVNPDLHCIDQVRWNNYDRAPKRDWHADDQELWYEAARHFNEILNRKERQIWTQLKPGTALIFDNWRMLHGRSKFTGKRRMCGGYVNSDDFLSRLRVLKYGKEKVMQNLGNYWKGLKDNPNLLI